MFYFNIDKSELKYMCTGNKNKIAYLKNNAMNSWWNKM